jgi:hypothetical protein
VATWQCHPIARVLLHKIVDKRWHNYVKPRLT